MTAERDGEEPAERAGRPPLTIDLAANPNEPAAGDAAGASAGDTTPPPDAAAAVRDEEAGGGAPAAAEPAVAAVSDADRAAPAASAPPPRRRGFGGYVLAGVIGAAVTAALLVAVATSGLVPVPGKDAADAAAAAAGAASSAVKALEARVAALEARPPPADTGDLANRVATLESGAKALAERVGKAETALAARPQPPSPPQGAKMDQVLDDLMARLEKVEAAVAKGGAGGTPSSTAVADLEGRVAALESSTAGLSQRLAAAQSRPPAASESEKAARALAIGSLRQAAAEGKPFAGTLAMLQALGLDETDIAALQPLAEKGAPPKRELAGAFPETADRILAASAAVDPNAGFFDRLAGFARGLVTVRPTTPIPGDAPDAVVSRMQAAVDQGDLARALAERDALPASGKSASAAWAQGAADRIAIDRLVEKLSRAAGAAAAPAAD